MLYFVMQAKDSHGNTALQLAAEDGHIKLVELLLEHLMASKEPIKPMDIWIPLLSAAANGHKDTKKVFQESARKGRMETPKT